MKKIDKIFGLFVILFILCTCKKDEPKVIVPENRDFDATISKASLVTINVSEIGGNGLELISSRDDDSPISKNSFNTVVSKQGEQLLAITDENTNLRAFTLSNPSSSTTIMPIDASSTAKTLIFISPGISTLDPQEAASTINRISTLTAFSPFLSYLKTNLISHTLNDLVGEVLYDSLLSDCVEEYYQKFKVSIKGEEKGFNETKNMFSMNLNSANNMDLKNYGFRFVNIIQRDINSASGELKVNNVVPSMKGAVPLSWGSLFTLTTADPASVSIEYTPYANSSLSEFWVAGPGIKKLQENPPESVKSVEQPYVETVVYYVIFPVLDLWAGVKSLKDIASPAFKEMILKIKLGKSLYFVSTTDNAKSATREISNYAISVLGAFAGAAALPGAAISLPGAAIVAQVVTISSVMFSGANLVAFAIDMAKLEPYSKFSIMAPNGVPFIPVLESPATNSINVSKPVALHWKSSTNAKSYTLQVSKSSEFEPLDFSQQEILTNSIEVPDLQNGQKYFWRVRAANENGKTDWSETWNFKTEASSPAVLTSVVNNPAATSANVGGTVVSDGGLTVTERGILWATSNQPESNGTKLQIGSGTGVFSASLTGLIPNTTYFIKAYAINSKGTSFGSLISFKTAQSIIQSGKISGIVRDASTSGPLSNVTINVFLSATMIATTSSQSDGRYEVSLQSNSGYVVLFVKQGYLNAEYQNVNIAPGGNTFLEPVLQIDQAYSGIGIISGTIKNALDGSGISGVSLKLRSGINVTSGSIIASTTSDVSGYYTFNNITAGNYTVEATNSNFNTTYFSIICLGGTTTMNQDATMSPVLTSGETRIVLTWGATPSDLDSHFTGPLSDGTRFHMFYPYSSGRSPWPETVTLDLDDVTSYGPETTTLAGQITGVYRFSVHDFSDRGSTSSNALSNSGAQVKVYQNSGLVATFNVPPNTGGTLWTVFEMDGTTLTPINQLTYVSDPAGVTKGGYTNPDSELFRHLPMKY
jgi:hypothetical protein